MTGTQTRSLYSWLCTGTLGELTKAVWSEREEGSARLKRMWQSEVTGLGRGRRRRRQEETSSLLTKTAGLGSEVSPLLLLTATISISGLSTVPASLLDLSALSGSGSPRKIRLGNAQRASNGCAENRVVFGKARLTS